MNRKTALRLVAATVALFAAGAIGLWFMPFSVGEYRDSPDGRYTAHADNRNVGTITGDREWHIVVRVVEKASGREVWKVVHHHTPNADVPDYGKRGVRFIEWAADSSSVSVPVVGGRALVLAVP